MSNVFSGIGKALMHPVNEAKWMWQETKNVGKPLLSSGDSVPLVYVVTVPAYWKGQFTSRISTVSSGGRFTGGYGTVILTKANNEFS